MQAPGLPPPVSAAAPSRQGAPGASLPPRPGRWRHVGCRRPLFLDRMGPGFGPGQGRQPGGRPAEGRRGRTPRVGARRPVARGQANGRRLGRCAGPGSLGGRGRRALPRSRLVWASVGHLVLRARAGHRTISPERAGAGCRTKPSSRWITGFLCGKYINALQRTRPRSAPRNLTRLLGRGTVIDPDDTLRPGQGDQDRATRTGRPGQGDQDRATRTGRPGQGDQDRATRTGRPGQGGWPTPPYRRLY